MLRQPTISLRSLLIYGGIAILCTIIALYALFQARFIIVGPVITLSSEPAVEQNTRIVLLSGNARSITNLTLNGRQIFTDEQGNFEEALILENGYTIATLEAVDRYGRNTRVVRPFVYQPSSRLPVNTQ
ncbi:MAG: hypothetical protein AAGA35_03820 [Patescibacteria group bacterium]